MLKEVTNENLIRLNIEATNWEEAIKEAASALLKEGKITENYIAEIIQTAKEKGPYIVITKHVALPHARPESGALANAVGIATLKEPVVFGNKENDPVKYLFCLSATDNEKHLKAIADLVELLDNEEFFKFLDAAKDEKEVMNYIEKL